MKKILFTCLVWGMLLGTSCSEDFVGQSPTDKVAPGSITEVSVKNLPGGAEISYNLPVETDISYVKGVYSVKGDMRVVRSSVYNNVLKIEGLGTTEPLDVTLYVVDHSENVSEPYKVTVNPLTPVVEMILESMQMKADFGGVNVTWTNEMETEIGITIMASNDKGEMEDGATYYTQTKDGNYSFRGYDTQLRTFSLYLTDKWGNVSDTISQDLTPMYEEQFDKKKHKQVILPLDNSSVYSGSYPFVKIFDDNAGSFWHTAETGGIIPICFTIDLGATGQLSRFKLFQRGGSFYYSHYNPKTFEVWGCTDYKKGMLEEYWTEEWKQDWVQLGDFVTYKPSGEGGPVTNEDKEYASKGFEYMVPLEVGNVRYLRFVVKSTWGGAAALHFAELTFWGNPNPQGK